MDNAVYNHTSATEQTHLKLQQTLSWAKPHQPTEKSGIEHYNHRVKNHFCSRLDGWRGSKDNPNGHKEGMQGAILTIQQFRQSYIDWVTRDYLNDAGQDGRSPKQNWFRFYSDHRPAVRWTREQVGMFLLTPIELTFRDSGGLLRARLRYQSDELAKLCKHLGRKSTVLAFSDRTDLGYLLVKNPHTSELIRVPCIEDPRYINGLTDRQHQLILKRSREQGSINPTMRDCVAARQNLAEQTTQLRTHKKLRKRWQSMTREVPAMPQEFSSDARENFEQENLPLQTVKSQILMTDLEYSISELDKIELDDNEVWQARKSA